MNLRNQGGNKIGSCQDDFAYFNCFGKVLSFVSISNRVTFAQSNHLLRINPDFQVVIFQANFKFSDKHDALSGFELDIEHLDGHKVRVTREKITWPGARIRKKGEGMPNFENNNLFGTMYITFDVDFPKGELSQDDKDNIAKILNQDVVNKVYNGLGGFS